MAMFKSVSVVTIVGIGGVGKTELARLAYDDYSVTEHFELKIWVCVSKVFDVKQIAVNIIQIVMDKKPQSLHMEAVAYNLRSLIDGKKYLLVLDDVRNDDSDKWMDLRNLLMGGAKGSKILITTRKLVGNISEANSFYTLKGLSSKESWSLFKELAFKPETESEKPHLVEIGKEIVKKCAGIPLAIRALGSLLYSKNESEWLAFKNSTLAEIDPAENIIRPILKSSYDDLSRNLKQCFALCSIYPENHVIDKSELIQLWMAHGFIPTNELDMEDVGNSFFLDLLRRSFFQEDEIDKFGNIISCKMPDLIYDLAKLVAGTKHSKGHLDAKNVQLRIRHVDSFIDSSLEKPDCLLRANNIATLLLPHQALSVEPEKSFHKTLVSTFKCLRSLRVLNMHNLMMKMVPSCISKLKHLRYLDLSCNDIKSLPNSITKLPNLQTLKLSDCRDLEELPKDFRKLISLRHLELNFCYGLTGMPWGLGQLTSLRTLTIFIAGPGSRLSELEGLKNLRGKLKIEITSGRRSLRSKVLNEKEHLRSLELNFRRYDNADDELVLEGLQPHRNLKRLDIRWYGGLSFPRWMMESSLPNLVSITLLCCYRWEYLPPQLGQLRCLEALELGRLNSLMYIDNNSTGYDHGEGGGEEWRTTVFPALKHLSLIDLPKLKGWWRSTKEEPTTMATTADQQHHQLLPSFHCLSKSYVKNCPNLASMPLQPTSVQLKLDGVSEKLVQQQLLMIRTTTVETSAPSSSSLDPHHPKLAVLFIDNIEDLVTLPDKVFQSLTSLWKLWICNCLALTSLPRGMQNLTALQSLRIHNCQELDLDDDGMPFLGLTNLTFLEISQIPKLVSLPASLQSVPSLQSLSISRCENLTILEQLDNLIWLRQLSISLCPKLTSLPEGMRKLTALQQLEIENCSKVLYDRCQKETGKDWPKIARFPKVSTEALTLKISCSNPQTDPLSESEVTIQGEINQEFSVKKKGLVG